MVFLTEDEVLLASRVADLRPARVTLQSTADGGDGGGPIVIPPGEKPV